MQLASKKNLSVFGLVMINVIAIDSLRTLPMGAVYGFSLVFYYLLAALVFFIPVALVAAELATGYPETGGLYVWVREAFGKRIGFVTIFLQWFYNICWYPTIMAFIAATLAYCIEPQWADNKVYMLTVITLFFWGSTWVNCFGINASAMVSTISAIIGTLLPMLFIIVLAIVWLALGKPIQIELSYHSFMPNLANIHSLVLLTGMIFGLVGMEMSASHAGDVRHPQRDYPKAVFWSALIILASLILSSLAIALVVPPKQLSLVSGLLEAFDIFFKAFHLHWFTPILALLIICGALGCVNAWLLGPSKGLLIASQDGCLPQYLCQVNRRGAPVRILGAQGVLFTVLCLVFILMPTVNSSFWVLSAITSILSFVVYVLMFAAAIRLRYKHPHLSRAFKVPGGLIGLWLVCLVGLASCLAMIVLGFLPPDQLDVGHLGRYEAILIVGVLAGCAIPLWIYSFNQRQRSDG